MEVKVLSTSTIILVHKTQSKSSFYDRQNCQQSATTTIIEAKLRDQERKDTASHKNEMEDFFFFSSIVPIFQYMVVLVQKKKKNQYLVVD